MSKKESEFDRYERMKKLEKESALEKRKALGETKKKSGRPRNEDLTMSKGFGKNHSYTYDDLNGL